MNLIVNRSEKLQGCVNAPPSKSHTHRAIILASLADGTSKISNALLGADCLSTIDACRKIGAEIEVNDNTLKITGVGGKPLTPSSVIDVGNSGTTLRLMSTIVALCDEEVTLTGDDSIQKRPIGPLLDSLKDLGAQEARAIKGNGCSPALIRGRLKGGNTTIESMSSQFITGLLIACALAERDSTIDARNLISKPYIQMTLDHLKRVGIEVEHESFRLFRVRGNQRIQPQDYTVPGDYSSASFLLAAAHVTDSNIEIRGLDPLDSQGDKAIIDIIREMSSGDYRDIDLSDTPDLLPIVAVLGCFSEGKTVLKNVEHARIKESDRIATIVSELKKMGADIEERRDGLVVNYSKLHGAYLQGCKDHRIVMALAVAGLGAEGTTIIKDAESISVSFPNYQQEMQNMGANISIEDSEGNTFGKFFKLTTYGESHGHSVGTMIEGCPAGTKISLEQVQKELDRRRPGKSSLTSPRNEPDKIDSVSGIKDGKATGEPIILDVKNKDVRSKDYDNIRHMPRPGHADLAYYHKYGRISPGGGRSSARETIGRVMGGAIAKQILAKEGITIEGRVTEVFGKREDHDKIILNAKKEQDSVGGIVEIVADGVPPCLGEPVFDKLDADLAKALMSIGSVKGMEIGSGFASATMRGSENNDPVIVEDGQIRTRTNNAGGILGGISNGMPIVVKIAVKPTSSIGKEQDTIDLDTMEPAKLVVEGRHDPCICQRIVPVAEAMVALVLVDHLLRRQ